MSVWHDEKRSPFAFERLRGPGSPRPDDTETRTILGVSICVMTREQTQILRNLTEIFGGKPDFYERDRFSSDNIFKWWGTRKRDGFILKIFGEDHEKVSCAIVDKAGYETWTGVGAYQLKFIAREIVKDEISIRKIFDIAQKVKKR